MKHTLSSLTFFLFISVLVGQPTFTEHVISTSADGSASVYAADVDGDGDMDVLSASSSDDKIAWYEQEGSPVPTTYVPDDNFEQALIDLGYDDVLDNYVVTDSISGVTTLDVGEKEISDLTGIEAFTALISLSCDQNQLTSLDVSANTALTILCCYRNQLTALDVSANTSLTDLICYGSSSTSTHGVTNQITSLDVSNNTALSYLHCAFNQLTTLDVSNNTALTSLSCSSNDLTALDVSNNTALTSLYVNTNDLTAFDVSNNTALTTLSCYSNQLTALDVSANTALTYLKCQTNQLTYLNVRNGVTDALTTFNATNNPDLTCIETLDPVYATENWTSIDDGVTFSVICGAQNQDV